jgi:hypothetical protein
MRRISEGGYALGALTLLAAWLFVALPLLYRPHATIQHIAPAAEQHSPNHEPNSKKEETDEALAYYTLWLMVFTGVLAAATLGLGIATFGLYLSGEKQIRLSRDIFVASQRPWLKVTVSIAGDFHSNEEHGSLDLKVTAENVGSIPAVSVMCQIVAFPNRMPGREIEQYQRLSDFVKWDKSAGFGTVLFPETFHEFSNTIATWHKADIDAGMAETPHHPRNILGFCVCVDYMSSAHDRHYQTGFIYNVFQETERAWIGFGLDAGHILQADLTLGLHPLGSHAI